MKVGTRVELAPHLDLWMRGARFGTVKNPNAGLRIGARNGSAMNIPTVMVELDKLPGRARRFFIDELTEVSP